MWYFIWVFGVFAASGFAIYNTLKLEKADK
ncbi:cytochrome bd-I oxidase subunit CydX [Vibrio sp. HA2012]|nr:cytochrome bd-I oxidase subunit CydX [Vibrio sp. HA2012]PJC87690.1 cytochrome bd-I oxidase subunit CydX [Vibrio sp. HA2012]